MTRASIRVAIALFLLCTGMLVVAEELTSRAPVELGLSADRLARLDAVVQKAIDDKQVAGAVVLIQRRGAIAHFKAFGEANVNIGRSMRKDDIFRIASMTKAITSAGVMMLYEEGHFQLDDPIGKYLHSFDREMKVISNTDDGYELVPATRPITIRHLLTHTSGLTYRFMDLKPLSDWYAEAGISDGLAGEVTPLADFVPALAELPLAHQPGESWTYGLNTDVLGRLIEVVSQQRLDEFLAERIFEPLEMTQTFFELPVTLHSRMPAVYRLNEDGELSEVPPGIIDDGPVRFSIDYPYDGEIGFVSGGGGLSSTASDYGRFLQMILNGGTLDGARVLGRKTVELMTSNQTGHIQVAGINASGYTLGFSYDEGPSATGQIGSPGVLAWGGFFNTAYWIDPQEELVAVVMTQHYPFGIPLISSLRVMVYQAIID